VAVGEVEHQGRCRRVGLIGNSSYRDVHR
jgi:hypothetical protein